MPTVLQSELTVNDNVVQALDRIRQQALIQYPKEAARITRGHAIAVQGGVHLDGHGLAAVQSQRHPEAWYTERPLHVPGRLPGAGWALQTSLGESPARAGTHAPRPAQ